MGKIAIVTDSTADLSLAYYEKNDVLMVPLNVYFGDEQYRDWIEMTPEEFYKRLGSTSVLPRTSQPAPADFAAVYHELSKEYEVIISCHISSKLSGTVNSAESARALVPDARIEIIDSHSVSMGLGVVIEQLVRDRDSGMDADEIIARVRRFSTERKLVFALMTLTYLEKGGRLGKGAAFLGSMLNIKPLLTIDSEVLPYKRVRGESKIIGELVSFVKENINGNSPHVVIGHANNHPGAVSLKEALTVSGISPITYTESTIGSVIGTYSGPGALGIAFFEE